MYRSSQSFQFRWVFSFVNAHNSLGKRSEMTSRIDTSLSSRKDMVKSARVTDIIWKEKKKETTGDKNYVKGPQTFKILRCSYMKEIKVLRRVQDVWHDYLFSYNQSNYWLVALPVDVVVRLKLFNVNHWAAFLGWSTFLGLNLWLLLRVTLP